MYDITYNAASSGDMGKKRQEAATTGMHDITYNAAISSKGRLAAVAGSAATATSGSGSDSTEADITYNAAIKRHMVLARGPVVTGSVPAPATVLVLVLVLAATLELAAATAAAAADRYGKT